jgi:hypothetical protein
MAKLNVEASTYEAPKTKNIADLDIVNTDVEVYDREGKDKDGLAFKYKVVIVEDVEYRVPGSVLNSLKAILAKNPNLKTFSVTKQGEGLNTKYIVIPQA